MLFRQLQAPIGELVKIAYENYEMQLRERGKNEYRHLRVPYTVIIIVRQISAGKSNGGII